ncbi:hypothetical protein GCM10022265_20960 [Marinobacter xestospongiae]
MGLPQSAGLPLFQQGQPVHQRVVTSAQAKIVVSQQVLLQAAATVALNRGVDEAITVHGRLWAPGLRRQKGRSLPEPV